MVKLQEKWPINQLLVNMKYRIIQDQKYISDFDKLLIETKNIELENKSEPLVCLKNQL